MRTPILLVAGALGACSTLFGGNLTTEPSYLNSAVGGNFNFKALVTTGDRVPLTGGAPGQQFAFTGIPDAMGLYRDPATGENILFVGHELPSGVTTAPIAGQPQLNGAWVSRYVLANDGSIVSGGLAHQQLFLENTFLRANPPQAGDAASFTRFCSGSFAGLAQGFDRPIFFTNEESATGTYDAKGSQAVAIVDGKMHTLPALGRVARENTLVMPRRDAITAIICTEDSSFPSYLYLYVGTKQRRNDSALDKNGLTGGKVYVLAGRAPDAGKNESSFTTGTIQTRWVEIPNAAALDATQLALQADALGAFGFTRVEDAEYDPLNPTRTMFVAATGGLGPNRLGRLYRVDFNPADPKANGTLSIVYNTDQVVTPGGSSPGAFTGPFYTANGGAQVIPDYVGGSINNGVDYPVSSDNIAVTKDYIVICEDRNAPADAVFAKYARNGGVWTLDRNNGYAAKYQADFNFSYVTTRDAPVTLVAGIWEASGVIDASSLFGPGAFLINVQAHGTDRSNIPNGAGGFLTKAQADDFYSEDGQVLLMTPKP